MQAPLRNERRNTMDDGDVAELWYLCITKGIGQLGAEHAHRIVVAEAPLQHVPRRQRTGLDALARKSRWIRPQQVEPPLRDERNDTIDHGGVAQRCDLRITNNNGQLCAKHLHDGAVADAPLQHVRGRPRVQHVGSVCVRRRDRGRGPDPTDQIRDDARGNLPHWTLGECLRRRGRIDAGDRNCTSRQTTGQPIAAAGQPGRTARSSRFGNVTSHEPASSNGPKRWKPLPSR